MKLKIPSWAFNLAYKFIDVEAIGDPIILDQRVMEYSFAISKLIDLPEGSRLLDVGCVARINPMPYLFAEFYEWKVTGIDIRECTFKHKNFTFMKSDIRNKCFLSDSFDVVTAVSTLEHIGVRGRYGITKRDSLGDWNAVQSIRNILKPGGIFIATLPFGNRKDSSNLGKVYDENSLSFLFNSTDWDIKDKRIQNGLALLELVNV